MRESIATLRKKVLTMAVSGLLVPQNPSEGTGEELYQHIQEARAKAAKTATGRKKNAKPLPPIAQDEIPFEIPSSWRWVRLGDITNYGTTDKCKPKDIKEGTWVLELEDIDKDGRGLLVRRTYPERKSLSDKNLFNEGDVLYGKLRPYLNKVICATEGGIASSELLPLRAYGHNVGDYLRLVLLSDYFSTHVNERTYGMKMPRLGTEDGRRSLIPLPSLSEQQRIVAKIDEIMATLDTLEAEAGDVETLLNALEKRILSEAVAGKLVPQDSQEGTGEELYQRIQKVRAEAAKTTTGRKKNAKPLPPIAQDEIPFEIPSSWRWVRLGEVCEFIYGKALEKKFRPADGIFPAYGANGELSRSTKFNCDNGGIIIGRKGSAGAVTRVRESFYALDVTYYVPEGQLGAFDVEYLFSLLQSLNLPSLAGGVKPGLNRDNAYKKIIGLPPLAEQQRIVAKVDEAMSLIQTLREAIK